MQGVDYGWEERKGRDQAQEQATSEMVSVELE